MFVITSVWLTIYKEKLTKVAAVVIRREQASFLSGGDDGIFKLWDFRSFQTYVRLHVFIYFLNFFLNKTKLITMVPHPNRQKFQPTGVFKWHSQPITSVEWHPSDSTVLAVSGADDQVHIFTLIAIWHDHHSTNIWILITSIWMSWVYFVDRNQQY